MRPGIALIISTYNWPQALEHCLNSVLKQTLIPDEIIIADDGSVEETRSLIAHFQEKEPRIKHIWHPDEGFRLSVIRNKAIASTGCDYIIQIDGDVIIHPHFIEDHMRFAYQGFFICGSRVSLSKNYSEKILIQKSFTPNLFKLPIATVLNSIRIPLLSSFLLKRYKKNKPLSLRGCNMSFWKKDLIRVNGYNEDIQGWGSEDAELAIRLINSGIKKHFLKFSGIVYHIWHKGSTRSNLTANETILQRTIDLNIKWCDAGIQKQTKNA